MLKVSSKDAQSRFGELVDSAQKEPVVITRHGRVVAVVLSKEDYERFQAMEDAVWAERAREALKSGFVGPEETAAFIQRKLNADS